MLFGRVPVTRRLSLLDFTLRKRGGGLEDYCEKSWAWMAELSAPAALVGGAALTSFFELRDRCGASACLLRGFE